MPQAIQALHLPLPFHLGRVNSYLLRSDVGFVLIDTGGSNARQELVSRLDRSGCASGSLRLILLTHGDFDHIGNAAYLRTTMGATLAMHPDDAPMAEHGDMFANRRRPNALLRTLLPLFAGLGSSDRFSPDVRVRDGFDLSPYGLRARVVEIPGHSRGSVGILTADHSLFCGDLLENQKRPALNALMDDQAAARRSLERLQGLEIGWVYPGHGKPFEMKQLRAEAP
jgi:glyoxylase-like metal-dependent hydrolase (beta-lactamase superfamily II)